MLDLFKQLLVDQFEAALCTLNACVDRCPDAMWNAPVGNLAFCQAAFHAVFYADLYLGHNEEEVRRQPFHLAHEQVFRDYEELEKRRQQLFYDRPFIQSYVEHCRDKARAAVTAETEASLAGPSGFPWLKFPRGELYVYNIRHIQHHAAQLSLRLRLDAAEQIPWFGSGWHK